MVYSVKELLNRRNSYEKLEFLFFFGHTPSKNKKLGKYCFSQ